MPSRPVAISVAAAALLGLAAPPAAAATMLAMPLCGGGTLYVILGGKDRPAGGPGACHAICAAKRESDEERDLP